MSGGSDSDEPTEEEIRAFDTWYYELEGFSLRAERVYGDIQPSYARIKDMHKWLLWAFVIGRRSK